jgi:hypothetical protein
MALTRDQILAANDMRLTEVEVPSWGGTVLVRTMTAGQKDAFEAQQQKLGPKFAENVRARLVASVVCDAEGNLLFTEADVEALGKKSVAALDLVFNAALGLAKAAPTATPEGGA